MEKLQEAVVAPYLSMSLEEMSGLLARNDIRNLPGDFPTIARLVNDAAHRNGLPPELLLAVIYAESSFRQDALSDKGAMGLMQLMPGTAAELATELRMPWTGEALLYDPKANIELGAFYLSKLLDAFDDLDRALAAYNRGPWAPEPAGGYSDAGETARFTRRVKALISQASPQLQRSLGEPQPYRASRALAL